MFEVAGGFSWASTNRTGTIVNLGLAPPYNISDARVRLRSIRLVDQPKAIRIVSISAYLYSQAGPSPSVAGGNLPKCFPNAYIPHPVMDAVTPPHTADPRWYVIIAFRIVNPGVYHLNRAIISYVANGQRGWQYQTLKTTITGRRTPPGARPLGCP